MERLLSIEGGTDITVSTFPLPRDIYTTRRALARNRFLLEYFSRTHDFETFRDLYMDYQWFWHELRICILEDLRTRIHRFLQTHNLPIQNNNGIRHGYLRGCDANAARFLSLAFRILRDTYTLEIISDGLHTNMFYRNAHPSLIQVITQLLYDCIVSPRPGGFVFSFHRLTDQDEFVPERVVVNQEQFRDDHVHTVPIVPFIYKGGSLRVFCNDAYVIALQFPIRLQNDTLQAPNVDDLLHDHDIVFQAQFHTQPPPANPGDYTRINNTFEILTHGLGRSIRTDFLQAYQNFCNLI